MVRDWGEIRRERKLTTDKKTVTARAAKPEEEPNTKPRPCDVEGGGELVPKEYAKTPPDTTPTGEPTSPASHGEEVMDLTIDVHRNQDHQEATLEVPQPKKGRPAQEREPPDSSQGIKPGALYGANKDFESWEDDVVERIGVSDKKGEIYIRDAIKPCDLATARSLCLSVSKLGRASWRERV